MKFEYAVIPAPTRTKRQKGVKTAAERLAFAMEDAINEMAEEGWEYLRTDTLTVEDKAGRFSKIVEKIETVLVFRQEKRERVASRSVTHADATPVEMPKAEPVAAKNEPVLQKGAAKDGKTPSLGGVSRD